MVTIIREINNLRRQLKENDEQLHFCKTCKEYDKLKQERIDIYSKIKMQAEDLARAAQINIECEI